jgi:Domain of unknown function (DUF3783)
VGEEGTFRPVMKCNIRRVGARALLLTGYTSDEATAVTKLLGRIEAGDVLVVPCAAEMLDRKLGDVLESGPGGEPVPAEKLPRVLVMSGLTGSEFHDLMDNYKTTGLQRPIFAAATPNNLEFSVKDLLIELLKEQRGMAAVEAARRAETEPEPG